MRRLAVAILLSCAVAVPALAGQPQPYTAAALQKAESEGKPIVVHVTATWCGTCAAQIPIVQQVLKELKYKDVVLFNVDFDDQKDALRSLKVQAQSTFVAFKGKKEVGRSTGDTDKAAIEGLFDKTS